MGNERMERKITIEEHVLYKEDYQMKMLKAKLYEYEEEKRRSEADAIRGEKMENGWGSQIRSYVLQPYQMVKDLRTEVETSNTAGVLDGEIDEFIEAFLKAKK